MEEETETKHQENKNLEIIQSVVNEENFIEIDVTICCVCKKKNQKNLIRPCKCLNKNFHHKCLKIERW